MPAVTLGEVKEACRDPCQECAGFRLPFVLAISGQSTRRFLSPL